MATHERACNKPVAFRTTRLFALVVVVVAFAGVACSKSRAQATSNNAVAANVAPASACACGQASPLFCESLKKECATDPSEPDCEDVEAACACAMPDEQGACK
jgi:hypothetical protein